MMVVLQNCSWPRSLNWWSPRSPEDLLMITWWSAPWSPGRSSPGSRAGPWWWRPGYRPPPRCSQSLTLRSAPPIALALGRQQNHRTANILEFDKYDNSATWARSSMLILLTACLSCSSSTLYLMYNSLVCCSIWFTSSPPLSHLRDFLRSLWITSIFLLISFRTFLNSFRWSRSSSETRRRKSSFFAFRGTKRPSVMELGGNDIFGRLTRNSNPICRTDCFPNGGEEQGEFGGYYHLAKVFRYASTALCRIYTLVRQAPRSRLEPVQTMWQYNDNFYKWYKVNIDCWQSRKKMMVNFLHPTTYMWNGRVGNFQLLVLTTLCVPLTVTFCVCVLLFATLCVPLLVTFCVCVLLFATLCVPLLATFCVCVLLFATLCVPLIVTFCVCCSLGNLVQAGDCFVSISTFDISEFHWYWTGFYFRISMSPVTCRGRRRGQGRWSEDLPPV